MALELNLGNCERRASGTAKNLCSMGSNTPVLYYEVHPVWGWIGPHKIYAPLEPVNVTVFGNRVFADVVKLRCGPSGWRWALNPVSLVSL